MRDFDEYFFSLSEGGRRLTEKYFFGGGGEGAGAIGLFLINFRSKDFMGFSHTGTQNRQLKLKQEGTHNHETLELKQAELNIKRK